MSDSADVQLQLKKRARRRLIGAIAFAGLAAVVLPMVMDEEPKQQVQAVQIRIPGQDQPPLLPRPDPLAESEEEEGSSVVPTSPKPGVAKPEQVTPTPPPAVEKPATTTPEKKVEKPQDKPVEKPAEKPDAKAAQEEARRIQAILAGKAEAPATVAAANTGQQFVILIGAYADPANVKNLQKKLNEMSIKVYTEPLQSPQGVKTRVRAGPFPSRDAAEKALARMKRIGVDGTISSKS